MAWGSGRWIARGLIIGALALGAGAANAAPACDRACLVGHADAYLAALAAHDPSRLSFAPNLRFTENSIALNPGEALWGTVTRVGSYRLWAADPDSGQIAGYVTIDENDRPQIMLLRLKVADGRISEVETLINRTEDGKGALTLEKRGVDPVWLQPMAAGDRPSHDDLVRMVNSYFEGIMASSGDIVPFAADCDRWLDGKQDTNNAAPPPAAASAAPAAPAAPAADATGFRSTTNFKPGTLGCRANMNTKMFAYITSIQPRGFRVVDRERGIVVGVFMFNHAGWIRQVDVPGVGKVDVPKKYQFPDSTHVAEMFKIRNGEILRIEGIRNALPYGSSTGWEPPLAPPAGLPGAVWPKAAGR